MAGIGFEIRKLLNQDRFLGVFRAYTYAGLIGSGPWILSFLGILLIHILGRKMGIPSLLIVRFQTSVTYVIAFSLITSGILTLSFTRYASDRIFENKPEDLAPNFLGALALITGASTLFGGLIVIQFFSGQTLIYRIILLMSFILMNGVWLATSLLSGLKNYLQLVWLLGIGYGIVVVFALMLRAFGLEGLMAGFLLGHFITFLGMLILILKRYPVGLKPISFDFLNKRKWYTSLALIGLLYNIAIWADKFIFWFSPTLGQQVLGPLRSSLIYDIPIFLSYVTILPGMAVFLVRMETDFAEHYQRFYRSVREGATLDQITETKDDMVETIRRGILEIAKIQALGILITIAWGSTLLRWLDISSLYIHLLYIDVVAAGLQVVFLGLCNVLFYLDKRQTALGLSIFLLITNILFTSLSIKLGIGFYGYGFATALLLSVLFGLFVLDRDLADLEFRTFMPKL